MNLHVEQHNQHANLYKVAPLAENLKTLWFQDGIRDPSLNAVKRQSMLTVPILLTLTL